MQTKLIHKVRAIKSKKEIESILKAQRISEQVLRGVLGFIKTRAIDNQKSVTEKEVENFIKNSFVKYKAPILSFAPIVAFGKNTFNIHHLPSETKLKNGDIIMLDFGTTINHYCSDMTRTYFFGEPDEKQKELYLNVLKAMDLAMEKIQKGERKGEKIDKIARDFLNKKYPIKKRKDAQSDGFCHSLGHGVGTVIHEWPSFRPNCDDVIEAGMIMTIEPGVYLKNFGGIRIEDMILITKDGYKNLTNMPKDLKSVILKK